jgi:3-hydroxyacyl-[acyl-carrier-protein] dehydratase
MCYTKQIMKGGAFGGVNPSISAEIQVPAESPWFDGHFPGEPILPGVAQLALVIDLLEEALGTPVSVTEVSRVRFKRTIAPSETVTVHITPKGDDLSFGFHIESGAEPVCNGNIRIAGRAAGEKETEVEIIDPRREPKKES